MPSATKTFPHVRAVVASLAAALAIGATTARRAGAQDARPAAAAPAAGTEIVSGTVRGAGRTVVVGARVTVTPVAAPGGAPTGVGRAVVTDEDGQFRVPGVPAGRVTVAVRRIGYAALSIDTVATALSALDITMVPLAQKLSTVVVRERRRSARYTGPLADFNRRRDLGFGRFITAADIDARHPIRTTDLLRMVPGVNVVSGAFTNRLRIRNSGCDPFVWVDGMPALSGYYDIDAFDPGSIGGIEIYNGVATVPVELRGTRGEEACGVIAIWSRLPDLRPRSGRTYTAADLERLVEAATVYTAEQVDRPAHLDSTATLAVSYPDSLRNTHTPGEATVEFVVDTTGAVEVATVGVVAASHPRFADAARQAASEAKFIPAERAGHVVRQLVQLPLRWEAGR